MIPVSVIIVTRNNSKTIERCLSALNRGGFSEIFVVDSNSDDGTQDLAKRSGARVSCFTWNNIYPKKKQWCLDNLSLKNDWVFFVDADEIVSAELIGEIETLFARGPDCAGYFVKGFYVIGDKVLKHGLCNNKIALLDRHKMAFPVIDDLDIPGMGEIEGHYQPVLKPGCEGETIGRLKAGMLHYAYDEDWDARHRRYAAWEKAMNEREAWPRDPVRWRQALKQIFRALPGRGMIAFIHCYVFRLGCLEGKTGFKLACDRYRYYRLIAQA